MSAPIRLLGRDRLPVLLHAIRAFSASYFWTKCERCGRHFGGHQWRHEAYGNAQDVGTGFGGGRCAYCPRCAVTRDQWEPGWEAQYTADVWRGTPEYNRLV